MGCSSSCSSGCSTTLPCPCPAQGNPAIDSLEKLINCYWQNHQQLSVEETWYGSLGSLELAINEAALALADENVDLDHVPDRIPLTELATAKHRLLEVGHDMASAADFEVLFGLVRDALEGLAGISQELVFMTALRIGMQAGLAPQQIYLHDDVRDGAAILVEIEDSLATLERSQLPVIFQHPDLPSAVVQGCLSRCRHQLQWLKRVGQLT
ncbi:MAG: hypothetical protein C0624_13130 [Desulfuromonas sp.]|nr:MAG: hypothetical protein C0624_13130 [Desulfuromonas sp.]